MILVIEVVALVGWVVVGVGATGVALIWFNGRGDRNRGHTKRSLPGGTVQALVDVLIAGNCTLWYRVLSVISRGIVLKESF